MARFCTKCGRPLADGEICTCQQPAAQNIANPAAQDEKKHEPSKPEAVSLQLEAPKPEGEASKPEAQKPEAEASKLKDETLRPEPPKPVPPIPEQAHQIPPDRNQSQVNQAQANQSQVSPNMNQAQANQSQVPPNRNQSQTDQWQARPNADPNAGQYGQGQQRGASNQPYGQQRPRSPEAEWLNKKKDSIVRGTKLLIKEIVPLLKRPTEAVRTLAASGTKTVGLELIILNAVISLIVMLVGLGRIQGALGSVGSLMGADMSIDIPWFKAIVLVLCCTLGADCLEAVLLKVFTGVLKGNATLEATFSVVGQKALYSVVATLAAGLFGLLSLPLAWVLISVTNICILVFEFNAYASVVQNTPDRRMYAFMIAKAVITVIAVLLMYLLLSSMMTNMISSIGGSILNSFFR